MTQRNNRGFTLIELMIVVAIIGLLAGIGYPSYTEYVMRGKRSEARSGLLDAGAKLERYYSDNAQYADLATAGIQTSSDNGHYTISVTLANGNQDFTLRATPATFKDHICGYVELTHTGARSSQHGTNADCWGK